MVNFKWFSGMITGISDFNTGQGDNGCYKLFSVQNRVGEMVNFVISPTTYVLDQVMLTVGDRVTGYYDGDAPVPLIYPPQYRALIMTKNNPMLNVKVDFFNNQLISSDGGLKLNLSPQTQIVLPNGQAFTNPITNRNLMVLYGPTTRSIPAQTTPYKIIVWCS
ncbi:hypothetical protein [Lysinibacillus sp. 54212]|uniref:hypothetical protein n=1 Tax=Lysinibacillus sp. 54212 TaxID=3119829 RepID=UPI002FC83C8C